LAAIHGIPGDVSSAIDNFSIQRFCMKKLLVVCLIIFSNHSPFACTTFFINKNGELIFGRNYDWISDAGIVCTNLKGLSKTSMKTADGQSITWVSQFGSITFNQYGKEFPTGGMNEKGLVVELMWLDGTQYPKADGRPAVGVLQWIQYQLDNCSTIEQVIATDKTLRIASVNTPPLHYLVADANGHAATIEFLQGKMIVHKDKDLSLPVLTNNKYEESVNAYKNSSSHGNNSLERFGKACKMIQQLNSNNNSKPLPDQAFDILAAVSQGDFTKWSIVYDIANKVIRFRTNRFQEIKTLSFSAFDLSCTSTAKIWDMNQAGSGNISRLFEKFNSTLNKKIIETASRESSSEVSISKESQEALVKYPEGIKCH
jgi:penicillin V acylase-like amidase (Ntn superfamily)